MTRYFCDRCGKQIKPEDLFIVLSGIYKGDSHKYEICGKCYTGHYEYLNNKADGPVQKMLKEAVNTMQWVQEYIEAIGENHKDVYINALQGRMDGLIKLIKEDSE